MSDISEKLELINLYTEFQELQEFHTQDLKKPLCSMEEIAKIYGREVEYKKMYSLAEKYWGGKLVMPE